MGRAQLNPPIMFFLTSPDYCGIPCQDALHLRVRRLRDRDEPAFSNGGSKTISLRFMVRAPKPTSRSTVNAPDIAQWSGYPPYSRQIPIHDFRAPPQPITVASLARNVARTVKRFLQVLRGLSILLAPHADRARTGHGCASDADSRRPQIPDRRPRRYHHRRSRDRGPAARLYVELAGSSAPDQGLLAAAWTSVLIKETYDPEPSIDDTHAFAMNLFSAASLLRAHTQDRRIGQPLAWGRRQSNGENVLKFKGRMVLICQKCLVRRCHTL